MSGLVHGGMYKTFARVTWHVPGASTNKSRQDAGLKTPTQCTAKFEALQGLCVNMLRHLLMGVVETCSVYLPSVA
jgi:hypothetical protein